jgi:hypothetical protein
MAKYTFTLANFGVYNTRAAHNDTDWAAISLQVGANSFGTRTFAYGDINNAGDKPLYAFLPGNSGWSFESIDIPDPQADIGLSYQIVNMGHGSPSEIMARLQATGDTLAGVVGGVGASDVAAALAGVGASSLPAGGAGVWLLIAAGGIEALNLLWSWLNISCDGPVVADLVVTKRLQFDNLTAKTGIYEETRRYPGKDSPVGCGSNSDYSATFRVTREDRSFDLFGGVAPPSLIVNYGSGLCLDVPGLSTDDGVLIQQYALNYGDNQHWQIQSATPDPLAADSKFTITSINSSKCLDIPDGDNADGIQLQQFRCHGGPNQQWVFEPVSPDQLDPSYGRYYFVRNVASGKYLDVPGGSGDSGTIIQQFQFNGGDNQKWKILP